jgi:hypothetical protein
MGGSGSAHTLRGGGGSPARFYRKVRPMNRLLAPSEVTTRRPDWIEGEWITLADGQAWSFPPPESIAGDQDAARVAAREVVDNVLSLINLDAVRQAAPQATTGDPSGMLRTIGRMFALYQVVFFAGSALLKQNYLISDADCDGLMPFNYQVTDLADPSSKVHQTTPEILAISNAIAKVSGVNIGPELERITSSN